MKSKEELIALKNDLYGAADSVWNQTIYCYVADPTALLPKAVSITAVLSIYKEADPKLHEAWKYAAACETALVNLAAKGQ